MHDFLVLYKKGEKKFETFIYACLCYLYACLFFNWYQSIYVLFMQKGEKYLCKRGVVFGEFIYVYFLIYAYMCCLIYAFIEYRYCLLLCKS